MLRTNLVAVALVAYAPVFTRTTFFFSNNLLQVKQSLFSGEQPPSGFSKFLEAELPPGVSCWVP